MSQIWIGDWLRIWRQLGLSAANNDHMRLAELCGLRELSLSSGAMSINPTVKAAAGAEDAGIAGEDTSESRGSGHAARSDDTVPAFAPTGTIIRVEALPRRDVSATSTTSSVPQSILPPPVARLPARDVEPLFPRATTRALLSAAAATWRLDGPISMTELVDRVARWRPLGKLPRHRVPTVRVGAVLLISPGVTEPFAADVVDLRRQLRRIAGTTSVDEWWLGEDLQLRPRSTRPMYWPPAAGTPVLAVTFMAEQLHGLAARLSRLGCPLIAITPARGTSAPTRNLAVVGWDHRTRVASVMQARRRADRR